MIDRGHVMGDEDGRRVVLAYALGQVFGPYDLIAEGDGADYRVLKLANVSGVVVVLQKLDCLAREADGRRARGHGALGEEARERQYVFGALAQRRQVERDGVQAVEEVLAEVALAQLAVDVAVRRGDHPHVNAQRVVRSDAANLALLKRAE